MSSNAPVLNQVLRQRTDVDEIVRRLSKHIPKPGSGRYLHVAVWWWEPAVELSQRNIAQAWCGILASIAGHTHAEMWAALCEQLLGTVEVTDPITRKPKIIYRSSTTIRGKAAWSEFLTGIEGIARDHFDITLPARNDPLAWQAFRSIKRVKTE